MIVEALVAARESVVRDLVQRLRAEDPTAERWRPFFKLVRADAVWRRFTIQAVPAIAFSVLLPEQLVARLDELDPGNVRVVGAWRPDGLPVGMIPGDPDPVGTPAYPLRTTLLLEMLPDQRNPVDPENLPPVRPVAPYQAHGYAGWTPRRYDLG